MSFRPQDLASGGIGTVDVSRKDDAPGFGDIVECAGEDLNLHGLLRPLGPQPSASTNSATSARGDASVAGGQATALTTIGHFSSSTKNSSGTLFRLPRVHETLRRRDGLCPALLIKARIKGRGAKSSCDRSERTLGR